MSALLNFATRWVLIGYWLLLLAWELALVLWLRHRYPGTHTISQEAEHIASRGFSTLAFFWAGMGSHWFLNWRRPLWSPPWDAILGVSFWVLGAAYLAADTFDPRRALLPAWVQWLRLTPVACLMGLAAGYLLFPQRVLEAP